MVFPSISPLFSISLTSKIIKVEVNEVRDTVKFTDDLFADGCYPYVKSFLDKNGIIDKVIGTGGTSRAREDCVVNFLDKILNSFYRDCPVKFYGYSVLLTQRLFYRAVINSVGIPVFVGPVKEPNLNDSILRGLEFCFTGELNSMIRTKAIMKVRDLGGIAKNHVTKQTTHLVLGKNPGFTKLSKASRLGTPIIPEDEFLQLLSNAKR